MVGAFCGSTKARRFCRTVFCPLIFDSFFFFPFDPSPFDCHLKALTAASRDISEVTHRWLFQCTALVLLTLPPVPSPPPLLWLVVFFLFSPLLCFPPPSSLRPKYVRLRSARTWLADPRLPFDFLSPSFLSYRAPFLQYLPSAPLSRSSVNRSPRETSL